MLKELEEKILHEGKVLPGNILKVGSFLNQQLDVDLLMDMGREIARLYGGCGLTRLLTVETSGIPIAVCAGAALHLPVVFAKKHHTANMSGELYTAVVHSYTHGEDYHMVVARDYLGAADTVLLVDDFLANGAAMNGLLELCRQAGARVAGVAAAIEKGFQHGGDKLRAQGLRVESLALIESMSDTGVVFRP